MKRITLISKIDSAELRKLIRMSGMKLGRIEDELGLTYCTLAGRLNGKSAFTLDEVKILCRLLNISTNDRNRIFFGD